MMMHGYERGGRLVLPFGFLRSLTAFALSHGCFQKQLRYLNESRTIGEGGADGQQQCVGFHLLNLRDSYAFALLRGGPQAPVRRSE